MSKIATYGLWALKLFAAVVFIAAGGAKLAGVEMMVQSFEGVGVGQWFRYVTGIIEVGSGVLLFVPTARVWAALALAATMVGATATHLFLIGGTAVPALVLLVVVGIIAWAHRDELPIGGNLRAA